MGILIGLALAWSAILTLVPTGIACIKSSRVKHIAITGGGMFLLLSVLNGLVFYYGRPTAGIDGLGLQASIWLWMTEFMLVVALLVTVGFVPDDYSGYSYGSRRNSTTGGAGLIALIAIAVTATLLMTLGMAGGVFTGNRAKTLAEQVEVTYADKGKYPESDVNHVVTVPEQAAEKSINSAMGNYGSQFVVEQGAIQQMVAGHGYYLQAIRPKGFKEADSTGNITPGYGVADAERSGEGHIRTTYLDGGVEKKLEIKFVKNGNYGANLERHVWLNGFAGAQFDDWALEADDNWRPYWVASFNRKAIGGLAFETTVPDGVIVVDAQTGEIKTYPVKDAPAWIDRIYSAQAVKAMINWWGNWGNKLADDGNMVDPGYSPFFAGSSNRYMPAKDQEPTLVYAKDGHPKWQIQISSQNADQAAAGVVLFDARINRMTVYRIDGMLLESALGKTIRQSGGAVKYEPVHMALHKVYGVLTWVAPLVDTGEKEGEVPAQAGSQGLALLEANKTDGKDIIRDKDASTAFNLYRARLDNSGQAGPGAEATSSTAKGTVSDVRSFTAGGNTVFQFMLNGDTKHLYLMTVNTGATDSALELPYIQKGSKVQVKYNITRVDTRRDVTKYDDLALDFAPSAFASTT